MRQEYSYILVHYIHSRAAGEALNVGLVMYCREAKFIAFNFEYNFSRLSCAFPDFDGDQHRRTLKRLQMGLEGFADKLHKPDLGIYEPPTDAKAVVASLWPDKGLSYAYDDMRLGLTSNLSSTFEHLYDTFVSAKIKGDKHKARTDEEVWTVYRERLRRTKADQVLRPERISTETLEVEYDFTFRDDHLNVVQPLNLDYVRVEAMQDKATKWLGTAMALQGYEDLGTFYLLLGRPQNPAHIEAYEKAKKILNKMPIAHEIFEEEQAEQFAEEIAAVMREHSLLAE